MEKYKLPKISFVFNIMLFETTKGTKLNKAFAEILKQRIINEYLPDLRRILKEIKK
jgi:hypothetical protein